IDEKAVSEVTLYGLPMMSVNLASGRLPTPAPSGPVSPQAGKNSGLSFADIAPTYTLTGHDHVLQLQGGGTTTTTLFDASYPGITSDTQNQSGLPVVPQVVTDVHANGTVARGVVLLSASYTDLLRSLSGANAFRPLIDMALTDARGIRPAYSSSVF